MHGSGASVYVPSVGSVWILKVVVAISLRLVLKEMVDRLGDRWLPATDRLSSDLEGRN